MAGDLQRPLTRGELNRVLVANALTKTWPNVLVAVGIAAAVVVLGLPGPALLVAIVAWLSLSAITYFDEGEADRVATRMRERRRARLERGERVDPATLAGPIAAQLRSVLAQEARIREAIEGADLPFGEVSGEVDTFVRAAERAATRAQLLYDYLADQDRGTVAYRLEMLRAKGSADASTRALMEALAAQVESLDRAWEKLNGFYTEMERIAVELGNLRGQLLSVSAATEADAQRQLASDVRDLREQVGAVAEGMTEVLDEAPDAPSAGGPGPPPPPGAS